jgi:hypothetical protein
MQAAIRSRSSLFLLFAMLGSVGVTACADGGVAPAPTETENVGSVGLELKVGDTLLNTVAYEISGNGYSKQGNLNVAKSKTISALIAGIPAGDGYLLSLSAVAANDAAIQCAGAVNFDVAAGTTTTAVVRLDCRLPSSGKGKVQVSGSANVCPRIDALSVTPSEVLVGGSMALSAEVTDSDALPAVVAYAWSANGGSLSSASAAAPSFTCTTVGTFEITLTVSDTACSDTAAANVICSPDEGVAAPRPKVKVNEVESSQGSPGDWTELYNADAAAADVSGWIFKDNDDSHVYTIPAGTVIPAGGYFVIEEAAQSFGLGSADSARLFDAAGGLVDSYSWTAHAATTYGRCPDGSGEFKATTIVTKGAANDCTAPRPDIKVNEVESSGGVPGDWTELHNASSFAGDIGGWVFKDNDDTHAYVIPAGTVIPPGGYFVVEEAAQGFGLGSGDSARLFDAAGALVDSYAWTAHAAVTFGRCPNAAGGFTNQTVSSKGMTNSCPPSTFAWPGTNDVTVQDLAPQFSSNLSGLTYDAGVLWAVVNGPGTLFRLVQSGGSWVPDTNADWSMGKALRYPDGSGNPDSEGVTLGASLTDGIYVATERNNDASSTSRSALLRFDVSVSGASLTATHDFNVTALLPVVGANLGIEAVTWVPDSYLVAKGFFDQSAGHTYVPGEYADHGTGLFFVGLEGGGSIYVLALNHATGGAVLVATIVSGQTGVMGLEFDRETNYLWFTCDDTCNNASAILELDTAPGSATLGRFFVRRVFDRPSSLPNTNNEGFAIVPEAECSAGFKSVFWSDDNDLDGFSLRRDSVPCGSFLF